jgi:cytochrome P450
VLVRCENNVLIVSVDPQGNTLAFAFLELARHPEFQDKLRAEIYSCIGSGRPNFAYDNMPLLNALIKARAPSLTFITLV